MKPILAGRKQPGHPRNRRDGKSGFSSPLAENAVDRGRPEQALHSFANDVLGGEGKATRWVTSPARKAWRDGRGHLTVRDLFGHVEGDLTVAAAPLRRALVLDVDLHVEQNGAEASREQKQLAAEALTGVLGRHGLPHIHFDSRRGVHTWIRCVRDPSATVLDAIKTRPRFRGRLRTLPYLERVTVVSLGTPGVRLAHSYWSSVHMQDREEGQMIYPFDDDLLRHASSRREIRSER